MHMLRVLIIMLFAATAVPMWAAQLRVHGSVTSFDTRKPMAGVLVRIYKDGQKQHVLHTGPSGKYNAVLDNNASYVIRFSLPGHATKCFAVNTHGPAWEDDKRIMDIEVEMTMFEKVDGLDLSYFDLPLGIARFTPMTGVVSWNREYEARVKPEVDRLMHELTVRREQMAALADQRDGERPSAH
jgi:hypothetical protein